MTKIQLTLVLPWASLSGKEFDGNGSYLAHKEVESPVLPGVGSKLDIRCLLPDELVAIEDFKVVAAHTQLYKFDPDDENLGSSVAAGFIFPVGVSEYSDDAETKVHDLLKSEGWRIELKDGFHPEGFSHKERIKLLRKRGWECNEFELPHYEVFNHLFV